MLFRCSVGTHLILEVLKRQRKRHAAGTLKGTQGTEGVLRGVLTGHIYCVSVFAFIVIPQSLHRQMHAHTHTPIASSMCVYWSCVFVRASPLCSGTAGTCGVYSSARDARTTSLAFALVPSVGRPRGRRRNVDTRDRQRAVGWPILPHDRDRCCRRHLRPRRVYVIDGVSNAHETFLCDV